MNTSNNKQHYTGLIIVLVMFIGAIAGGIFFLIRSQTVSKTVTRKEKELSATQKEIQSLRRLRPEKTKIKAEYQRLLDYIPTNQPREEEVLWELGNLAEECELKINKCAPKNNILHLNNYPGYQVNQWQVELRGGYQQLTKFLEVIPKAKHFILISEIRLETVTDETKTGQLNGGYQLNAQLTLDLVSAVPQEKVEKK